MASIGIRPQKFEQQVKLCSAVQLLNRIRHSLMKNEDFHADDSAILKEVFDLMSAPFSTLVMHHLSGNYSPVIILSSLFFRSGITTEQQITVDFLNDSILKLGT